MRASKRRGLRASVLKGLWEYWTPADYESGIGTGLLEEPSIFQGPTSVTVKKLVKNDLPLIRIEPTAAFWRPNTKAQRRLYYWESQEQGPQTGIHSWASLSFQFPYSSGWVAGRTIILFL